MPFDMRQALMCIDGSVSLCEQATLFSGTSLLSLVHCCKKRISFLLWSLWVSLRSFLSCMVRLRIKGFHRQWSRGLEADLVLLLLLVFSRCFWDSLWHRKQWLVKQVKTMGIVDLGSRTLKASSPSSFELLWPWTRHITFFILIFVT